MADAKQFSGDKILLHRARVDEFFSSGNSRPVTVEFDMTNLCNHKCPFCFGFFKRKETPAHMSRKDAEHIITQLSEAGALAVTFTGGGDPLVNKSTIYVMEHAKTMGLDVALITNGLLLTEEIARRALNICTWIRVSVDADSPETYQKTHGVGKKEWEQMLSNIKTLVRLKKELDSGCTIGVGYLTTPDTYSETQMLSFTRIFKGIGVDYSQFRPVMPLWEEEKSVKRDESFSHLPSCLKESSRGYDVLYSKEKYELMQKPELMWRPYGLCLGVNFTTVVAADRKLYVCCHHRGIEKYCLGDLSKEKFAEIWAKRQKLFDRIDFKDCPYFCRNNPFNIILWQIKKGKEVEGPKERLHKNFL